MSGQNKTGFVKLRQTLTRMASEDLNVLDPEYVASFLAAARRREIIEHGLSEETFNNPQFRKWRSICIELLDVETQMHKIGVCLSLMNTVPPSDLNLGEWVDYHFSFWAILTQGLLFRTIKLFKSLERKLTFHHELDLISTIQEHQRRMKIIRDPIAHHGGAIEVIGELNYIGPYILLDGEYNIKDALGQEGRFRDRWCTFTRGITDVMFHEIHHVCDVIYESLENKK